MSRSDYMKSPSVHTCLGVCAALYWWIFRQYRVPWTNTRTFRDYQYPFARPFIRGFSASIGFCKRYLVPSRDIGMCLLDPLFAGFPPVKGFSEVYADKKVADWTEIFLSFNSKKTPSSVHKLNTWSVGIKVPASEQGGDELPASVPSLFVSVSHLRCE